MKPQTLKPNKSLGIIPGLRNGRSDIFTTAHRRALTSWRQAR